MIIKKGTKVIYHEEIRGQDMWQSNAYWGIKHKNGKIIKTRREEGRPVEMLIEFEDGEREWLGSWLSELEVKDD